MDKQTRTFIKLNRSIDDDYQKLCDRYESLTLSHNRKKKALVKISELVKDVLKPDFKFPDNLGPSDLSQAIAVSEHDMYVYNAFWRIFDLCDTALYSDSRLKRKCERRKK